MNAEAITAVLDALAESVADKVAAKQKAVANPNELMTVPQISKEFRIGERQVRLLITAGTLPRCHDIREMRVKRSEVEKYGTRASS